MRNINFLIDIYDTTEVKGNREADETEAMIALLSSYLETELAEFQREGPNDSMFPAWLGSLTIDNGHLFPRSRG